MKTRRMYSEEIRSTIELPSLVMSIFDGKSDEPFGDCVARVTDNGSCSCHDVVETYVGFIDNDPAQIDIERPVRRPEWERVVIRRGNPVTIAARMTSKLVDSGICVQISSHSVYESKSINRIYVEFYVFNESLLNCTSED